MNRPQSEFERLYREHVRSVYGFLSYRVGGRELAEDLTQLSFEKAMRGWSRFDPRKASERTWLLVIARNVLIDHRRKQHEDPVPEIDERMLPVLDGPDVAITAVPGLIEALALLTERDREVIALRFGGDMTGPEIAETLGLQLGNVQQILSRSLRRLRVLLDIEGADRGPSLT